jgi:hypothetical protein
MRYLSHKTIATKRIIQSLVTDIAMIIAKVADDDE